MGAGGGEEAVGRRQGAERHCFEEGWSRTCEGKQEVIGVRQILEVCIYLLGV